MAFRLYLDEDSMNRALIRALVARGLDLRAAVDAGKIGVGDSEQLEHSTAEGRVLFSYNVADFHHLHARWLEGGREHAGVIVAPQQRYSLGEQMRRVLRSSRERSSREMRNRIEFLSSWGRPGS